MNAKRPNQMSRAERLNYIVKRMHVRQDITPACLAEELHISERTIYRDLRSLENEQTLKKRYSRREGHYLLETAPILPPVTLTPGEAQALCAAASSAALCPENARAANLRAALAKLCVSLTPESAETPAASAKTASPLAFSPTSEHWQHALLESVRQAIRSNRKLRLRYWATEPCQEKTLVVIPYDLRAERNDSFLLAQCEELGGLFRFRMSCLRHAEILPDRFRYPRRFSSEAAFASASEPFGGDKEITLRIAFALEIAGLIRESRGPHFLALETRPDGVLVGTLRTRHLPEVVWWVLSFGNRAVVLGPPEVRAVFAQTVRDMMTSYIG